MGKPLADRIGPPKPLKPRHGENRRVESSFADLLQALLDRAPDRHGDEIRTQPMQLRGASLAAGPDARFARKRGEGSSIERDERIVRRAARQRRTDRRAGREIERKILAAVDRDIDCPAEQRVLERIGKRAIRGERIESSREVAVPFGLKHDRCRGEPRVGERLASLLALPPREPACAGPDPEWSPRERRLDAGGQNRGKLRVFPQRLQDQHRTPVVAVRGKIGLDRRSRHAESVRNILARMAGAADEERKRDRCPAERCVRSNLFEVRILVKEDRPRVGLGETALHGGGDRVRRHRACGGAGRAVADHQQRALGRFEPVALERLAEARASEFGDARVDADRSCDLDRVRVDACPPDDRSQMLAGEVAGAGHDRNDDDPAVAGSPDEFSDGGFPEVEARDDIGVRNVRGDTVGERRNQQICR